MFLMIFLATSIAILCCVAWVKLYPQLKELRAIATQCHEYMERTNVWRALPEEQWKKSFEDPHTKIFLEEAHASLERFITRFPEYTTGDMRTCAQALGMWKDWCILFDYLEESYEILVGPADEKTKEQRKITCEAAIRKVLADFMENSDVIERHSFLNTKWYRDILLEYFNYIVAEEKIPPREDLN